MNDSSLQQSKAHETIRRQATKCAAKDENMYILRTLTIPKSSGKHVLLTKTQHWQNQLSLDNEEDSFPIKSELFMNRSTYFCSLSSPSSLDWTFDRVLLKPFFNVVLIWSDSGKQEQNESFEVTVLVQLEIQKHSQSTQATMDRHRNGTHSPSVLFLCKLPVQNSYFTNISQSGCTTNCKLFFP